MKHYGDDISEDKPDAPNTDILSTLAINVANYRAATLANSRGVYLRAIRACLPDAVQALADLQAEFGETQPTLATASKPGCPVITITQTARGYRFVLPEQCAPSNEVVRAFRAQTCLAYHEGSTHEGFAPYRSFPADKLKYVNELLAYWFVEQDPRGEKGKSRNGSRCAVVEVADQNAADTVRWSNGDYTEAAIAAGGVLVIEQAA